MRLNLCQSDKCHTFLAQRLKFAIIKESKKFTQIMRKIEQAMNTAIANSTNWTSGNTTVHFNEEENISVVRLHGNKIAEVGDDFLRVFDGGWQTNTTKSRLNAIINRFCNGVTDGVFQKNYEWFVRDNNVTHDFVNGYTFA